MTKDWPSHKETIIRLYKTEGKTLEEVKGIMNRDYNFEASIRSYRQHLVDWRIFKYNCRRRQGGDRESCSPDRPTQLGRGKERRRRRSDASSTLGHYSPVYSPGPSSPGDVAPPSAFNPDNYVHGPSYGGSGTDYQGHMSSQWYGDPAPYPVDNSYYDGQQYPSYPVAPALAQTTSNRQGELSMSMYPHDSLEITIRRADVSGAQQDVSDADAHYTRSYPIHQRFDSHDALLMYHGSDLNVKEPKRRGTRPIHGASTPAAIKALLNTNADANARDGLDNTALHRLLMKPSWWEDACKRECIFTLLDSGTCNINLLNRDGESPFHLAVNLFQPPFSRSQIEHLKRFVSERPGPDPTVRMHDGRDPFSLILGTLLKHLRGCQDSVDKVFDEDVWEVIDAILQGFLSVPFDPDLYEAPILNELLGPDLCGTSLRRLWGFVEVLITRSNPDRLDVKKSTALQCALQAYNLIGSDDQIMDRLRHVISTLLRRQRATTSLNHINADGHTALGLYLHHWQRDDDFFRIVEIFCSQGADTSVIVTPAFAGAVVEAARLADATHVNNLERTTALPVWIAIWTSACEQVQWSLAEFHLDALGRCTEEPPHTGYRDLASRVLLEKFLQSRRLQLEHIYSSQQELFSTETNRLASEFVKLLHVSKQKKVQVDMCYWHFVTELHLLRN